MNSYTASNGVGLTITRDRTVRWRPGIPEDLVSSALREYFQAERDEELGRWRDPENPNIVVYALSMMDGEDRCIRLLNELSGATWLDWGRVALPGPASRYFAAHPKPKPCDAAQPDEIWVLTIDNDTEEVFRCGERGLYSLKTGNPLGSLLSCGSNKITAGHRIWPEGENK